MLDWLQVDWGGIQFRNGSCFVIVPKFFTTLNICFLSVYLKCTSGSLFLVVFVLHC